MPQKLSSLQNILHPSHTPQLGTCVLTFHPQLNIQALQGVGRVPLLQGEPSKHSASHGEQHLCTVNTFTVTHPTVYLRQTERSLTPSVPGSLRSAKGALSLSPPSSPALDVNVHKLRPAERLRMNEWKRERVVFTSKRGWRERGRKRGREVWCFLWGGQRKGGRAVFQPGFPVGVKWGKEQQKVGL